MDRRLLENAATDARSRAHHSLAATYDDSKEVTLDGKIAELLFRNPHSFLHVEAPDKAGVMQRWSLERIGAEERGVLLYMAQEGRGIGLLNKIRAYSLQDSGADTVQANERLGFAPDLRNYGIGAQILRDLGLSSIRVMTNNPRKLVGLEGYGLEIVERVPLLSDPNHENRTYLQVKRDKLGHLFTH